MQDDIKGDSLRQCGLVADDGSGINGRLAFERPAWPQAHRLKDCTLGAFTFFNAAGVTCAYRVHFGRYSQIGESSILGPPEHPQDYFSSHPFAFTRPQYMPSMYQLDDFVRLAPEADDGPSYVDTVPSETYIGHEAYIGAGCFVKRGVRIGNGATIGARAVVTRDIPDYAIAIGAPARTIRLRFSEQIVERFQKLQWWRYDLAPFKKKVDYSKVEQTLAFFEQQLADGQLQPLRPDTYCVRHVNGERVVEKRDRPLYFA